MVSAYHWVEGGRRAIPATNAAMPPLTHAIVRYWDHGHQGGLIRIFSAIQGPLSLMLGAMKVDFFHLSYLRTTLIV